MKNCDISYLSSNVFSVDYHYSLTNFNCSALKETESVISRKGDRPWSRLMLIKSGTAKFSGNGFAPFYADKGSLLYYPSDCEFTITWENTRKSNAEGILSKIMAFSLFDTAGRELLFADIPTILKEDCGEQIGTLFDKSVNSYSGASSAAKLICSSALLELLGMLICPTSDGFSDQHGILSALRYINENYKSDISLKKLLSVSHMSESTLRRGFISETGMPPVKYINKVRMNKAYNLLTGTEMCVGSIASEVGIPDISYFSKLFKNFYGISPMQVRSRII